MGRTANLVVVVLGLIVAAVVVVIGGLDARRDRSSGVVANALANAERGSSYVADVRTRPLDDEGSRLTWSTFGWSDEQGDLWLQSTNALAGDRAQISVAGDAALLGVDFGLGAADRVGDAQWVELGDAATVVGELFFGTPGLTFRLLAGAVASAEEDGSGWVAGATAERFRVEFEPITITAEAPDTPESAASSAPDDAAGGETASRTVRITGGFVWLDQRERLAAVEVSISPVEDERSEGSELALQRISDRDAGPRPAVVAHSTVYVTPWESSVTGPPQPQATTTTTTAP